MATILIVDDVPANREVLVTLLSHKGHRLVEAENGRAGLAAAELEAVDLVITDLLMPIMDGYELVRQLRLHAKTRALPAVFCTAHYEGREAKALAKSVGVSEVLTKPIRSQDVVDTVDRLLAHELRTVQAAALRATPQFDRKHTRWLTDTLSATSADLRAAHARSAALMRLTYEFASERVDAEHLLQTVCEEMREMFHASYVGAQVVDLTGRDVQRLVSSGVRPHGGGVDAWPRLVDAKSPASPTRQRSSARSDSPATLTAAIASSTQVYGSIEVVGEAGAGYSSDDQRLLDGLARQFGHFYDLQYETIQRTQVQAALRRERSHAADVLRRAREQLQVAMDLAGLGLWEIDSVTGEVRALVTVEDQAGTSADRFIGTLEAFIARVHPDDRAAFRDAMKRAMKEGTDFSVVNRAIRSDGTVRWIRTAGRMFLDARGAPLRGLGISEDVTERRTLEDQFLLAQKAEPIAQLASSVAHDFSNLLTVMLGHCDLLLANPRIDVPFQRNVVPIQRAAASAAALIRQLLAYSRKQAIEPTLLDLNVVLADMRLMLERLLREDVTVLLSLQPELPLVRADRGQIEQVIMNLAVNARDAMPSGGILTIKTTNVELGLRQAATIRRGTPGSYVSLSVKDSGTGMTPRVQAQLFEPFFTTKEPGKGTGLGMAIVSDVVTRSAGSIGVSSELGKGSVITLYFPRVDLTEGNSDASQPATLPYPGSQTVLVVDDDGGVREMARGLLEQQGHVGLTAGNAAEAVRVFEEHPSISVVMTDMVMADSRGPELARRLNERRPVAVVYMSGHALPVDSGSEVPAGAWFLPKPFTLEMLRRQLGQVMADQGSRIVH